MNDQMMNTKRLPVGVEFFETIRKEDLYYVDKTNLIKELLSDWSAVHLFTRPRRFGKTLNMDMLRCFFEIDGNRELFEGLNISRETEIYEQHMGKYPVIFISLKAVSGENYLKALAMLKGLISREAIRHGELLNSDKLTDEEKKVLLDMRGNQMEGDLLESSILNLSKLLCKHYGKQVILLIDEYDVPLDKAYNAGYYEEMIVLIRNLMNQALKSNENLFFAVLTGCLRVSKESIFTGLNNVRVHTITDTTFDEFFGFTDEEVRNMLVYYGCSDRYSLVKEWYDGYRFGKAEVYCPWDVINHCYDLRNDRNSRPKSYWTNTSGNDIIRRFVARTKGVAQRREIESLIEGGTVRKKIRQELTYADLYSSDDNIWSVLLMTGYLTPRDEPSDENELTLAIPNNEIRLIFKDQIYEWFNESLKHESAKVAEFCELFRKGDAEGIGRQFSDLLSRTISIRDTNVQKSMKENFYHGYLLGLLRCMDDWYVRSNAESGDGYCDIVIEDEYNLTGILIEVKYAENDRLDEQCANALRQIESKNYEQFFRDEGYTRIMRYGIACYKKRCKAVLAMGD